MEALIGAAFVGYQVSLLRLSSPHTHSPRSSAAKDRAWLSYNTISTSRAVAALAPWTSKHSPRYKASSLCHCSAASTTPVADERLDFTLCVGSAVIPHPEKVEKGGEDAFFVSCLNGGVLGVADGVSGWAEENVDPALFSKELMEHALTALNSGVIGTCPRQLLGKAHEATSAIGAATVIIAILERETGILHVANLGDCGLRVMREGKIVFATSTQQHYFDCPYQLSSELGAQTSEDAMVYKIDLRHGDIVIMGSDGLFDNVFDKDIESTVNSFGSSVDEVSQRIASALASLASKLSKDKKYESPYSKEAVLQGYKLPLWKRLLGEKLTGGKLDDITVLTAHVLASPASPKEPPIVCIQEEVSSLPVEDLNTDFTPNELLAPAV